MLIKVLSRYDEIDILSPYIDETKLDSLLSSGAGSIIQINPQNSIVGKIYRLIRRNEAMQWAFSWLMEALFSTNSSSAEKILGNDTKEIVVNTSYTVPMRCRLFWNQATPPVETLKVMGKSNTLARIQYTLGKRFLSSIDRKVIKRHLDLSEIFINNSLYLKNLYESRGYDSKIVLHSPKEFPDIVFPDVPPTKDFVLAYIGKETEVDTILSLAESGIRIISFGAKIPYGTSLAKLKDKADFRGYVSESDLSSLYYNALFTAFPFTEEPFGWVPLESMQHGTPVLSYRKQGPSETIVDGKTGWLVETKDDFIAKAIDIWKKGNAEIKPEDCTERVRHFSLDNTSKALLNLIDGVSDD